MNVMDRAEDLSQRRRLLAIAAAGLVLAICAVVLPLRDWFGGFLDWVQNLGPWAPVVFVVVYIVSVVFLLPGWIMTVGAGLTFGIVEGAVLVSISATTAATVAFLIGRHLARDRVERYAENHAAFRAIDDAIGAKGWKILIFLRMSPAIPWNISNYLYGLTKLRLHHYIIGTLIGMQPGNLLLLYLGAAGRLTIEGGDVTGPQIAFMIFGFLITVGVTLWIAQVARRAVAESG